MGNWSDKLDSRARAALDSGSLQGPIEVLISVAAPPTTAQHAELEASGLLLWSSGGTLLGGRVDDVAALENVAQLDFVRQIELSRQFYAEDPARDHNAEADQEGGYDGQG